MKKQIIVSLLALAISGFTSQTKADLIINEIDYDNLGADTAEFIEFYNNGTAAFDLTGFSLTLFNGAAATPVSYGSFTLSGSVAPGGFYVFGNVAGANLDPAGTQDLIQNGASDGFGLYSSGTIATGAAVTTTNLYAGVVYEGMGGFPVGFELITVDDSNTVAGSLQRPLNTGSFALTDPATPGATNPVPEPSTYAMLVGGAGMMFMVMRRKRSAV